MRGGSGALKVLGVIVILLACLVPIATSNNAERTAVNSNDNTLPGAGFTVAAPGDDPDLTEFKADVDRIKSNGGNWIRFGVRAEVVIAEWGVGNGEQFDHHGIEVVGRAIDYANSCGMEVYLVSADTDPRDVSDYEYESSMRAYWFGLANAFKGDVAVWQIFNEPDGLHYRYHTEVPDSQRDEYYKDLGAKLKVAKEAISSVDNNTLVTTNVSGYPIDSGTLEYWMRFFESTAYAVDLLGVSAYPQLDDKAISELPVMLQRIQSEFDKQSIVAEIGMSTCSDCFSVEEQSSGLLRAIDKLRSASPTAILVYQLRDDVSDPESDFGLLYSSGRSKTERVNIFDPLYKDQD